MKYAVVVSLLFLVACAKTQTSPATQAPKEPVVEHASQELCDKVYDNLLGIVINNSLEEGQSYDPYQMKAAKKILNLQLVLAGKQQAFYNVCLNNASPQIAECWSKATSLEGMDLCTLMWSSSLRHK